MDRFWHVYRGLAMGWCRTCERVMYWHRIPPYRPGYVRRYTCEDCDEVASLVYAGARQAEWLDRVDPPLTPEAPD